jgi:hypothetical protein
MMPTQTMPWAGAHSGHAWSLHMPPANSQTTDQPSHLQRITEAIHRLSLSLKAAGLSAPVAIVLPNREALYHFETVLCRDAGPYAVQGNPVRKTTLLGVEIRSERS